MIKKDIIETEIRTSGFQKVQADITATSGRIDDYRDKLKSLQHQRTLLVADGKKETQEYRNLTKEINETTKSIKEETQVLAAHYSRLNLGEMSYNQLKKRAAELAKELRNTSRAAEPERYNKLEQELKQVNAQMGKLQTGAKQASSVFGNAVSVFAGNLMTRAVDKLRELARAAVEWVKEGTAMAAKAEGVQRAFNKLNDRDLLNNLRTATKGTVNDLSLMQAAVRAENFKIPLEGLGSLLKFAQQRAQETGESVDYLTESIILGLGRQSPKILDNLGISAIDLRNKVAETGDFMTGAIALVNEELEKQGTLALTAADKDAQAAVKWENAQLRVGQAFLWAKNSWAEFSGSVADGISELVGENRTANQVYDDQINKVAELQANIVPLVSDYEALRSKSSLTSDEQARLKVLINDISGAIPGVITAFDEYGNALDINIAKVKDYIQEQRGLLRLQNQEAIAATEERIAEREREVALLQADYEAGGRYDRYMTSTGGSSSRFTPFTDQEMREIEEQIKLYSSYNPEVADNLQALNAELNRLTGQTVEDQLNNQQKLIENRNQFNSMNQTQLKEWIDDERNANEDYLYLAKQIYQTRVSGGGDDVGGGSASSSSTWSLSGDEAYQQARLDLKQKMLAGEIATEKEYQAQLLQLEIETLTSRLALNRDGADTLMSIEDQLTDRLLQQQKSRADEQQAIDRLISDSATDLAERERQAHRQRMEEYGLAGVDRERMTAEQIHAVEILEQQHQDNLDRIENEEIARQVATQQEDFESRITRTRTRQNEELAALGDNARAREELERNHQREIEEMTVEHLKYLAAQLRTAIDSGTFNDAILSEEQKEELERRLEEVGLKLSEIMAKKGEVTAGDTEREYSSLGGKSDILGMSTDDWETFFTNIEDGKIGVEEMAVAAKAMLSAFSMYDSFVTASENRQLEQSRKNNEKKKANLQKRLDAGRMSQEQYNAAIEAMDADLERHEAAISARQARRQKAQAIIDSIINTAVAVAEALPNVPLSIAVGVLGAAQTALIAAQPVEGREAGGFTVERAQDGRRFNAEFAPRRRGTVSKPTVLVGENGNEYVIPADGYDNPTLAPIIRTIEDARLRGDLRSFDFRGVQPVRVVGSEIGGSVSGDVPAVAPADPYTASGTAENSALTAVLNRISAQLDQPLTAIVSILGRNGLKEKMDEYERSRNRGKLA